MRILQYIFFLSGIHKVQLYFIQNQNKPICANCKFFIANKNECSNFGDVDIITGKYSYEKATSVRNDEDKCGEYGFLFTPFYISNADFSSYKIYNTFYYIFQNSGMFRSFN